jgi:hypothetical protein
LRAVLATGKKSEAFGETGGVLNPALFCALCFSSYLSFSFALAYQSVDAGVDKAILALAEAWRASKHMNEEDQE